MEKGTTIQKAKRPPGVTTYINQRDGTRKRIDLGASAKDLQAQGINLPPYHMGCRTDFVVRTTSRERKRIKQLFGPGVKRGSLEKNGMSLKSLKKIDKNAFDNSLQGYRDCLDR